jgi:NifU-like protein
MDLSVGEDDGSAASCCSSPARRSASELCDDGLRRTRLDPFALAGRPVRGNDGLSAQFSLRHRDGVVTAIRFRASTCATLLAYCELMTGLATGRSVTECLAFTPQLLVSELPGVPVLKRDRAVLAVAAFASAVRHAGSGDLSG